MDKNEFDFFYVIHAIIETPQGISKNDYQNHLTKKLNDP